MDLIRIYSEIAFSKVALRHLDAVRDTETELEATTIPLTQDAFLDEARIHHPELSDDNLRLIFMLGEDEWCRFGYPQVCTEKSNIFRALAFMATQMLDERGGIPTVHFNHLFRWRETTQILGEDLMTCALLAYNDIHSAENERIFSWPSVAHNDNPDLNYLFRTKKLCELHSHLKATTSTFEISWVSLMNHINGLREKFDILAKEQEPSNSRNLGGHVYTLVTEAAGLRLDIHEFLSSGNADTPFTRKHIEASTEEIDSATELLRRSVTKEWIPDYISECMDSPMNVYAGERRLLYTALRQIYARNSPDITEALYRYLLIKALMRRYLIQTNKNMGFANFQRFQNLKNTFLDVHYKHLPVALPLWEAREHNHTIVFESRIAPIENKEDFLEKARLLHSLIPDRSERSEETDSKILSDRSWLLIFHFLKRKTDDFDCDMRDRLLREKNKEESENLAKVSELFKDNNMVRAIDAASSEFYCRPEVYGQAFRFLRHYGYDATFHAGEDFYDLADGLRAIDETISFLQLKPGDRLGHALALGIDAEEYYATRHHLAALPKQWMLDNSVWLLMKSKKAGISMDPRTEWMLTDVYKHLVSELGYANALSSSIDPVIPDISDYWDSMMLRGDDPNMYGPNGEVKDSSSPSPETWDHYALLYSEHTRFVRDSNPKALRLFKAYHSAGNLRKEGDRVRVFELPIGYTRLITDLQNAMIKEISKRQLSIECCPSSNVRIGRLDRFEKHPIFRFCPINSSDTRYPLAVTVNTDDLGVFSTSLPNEYSLLALALLKKKDQDGRHLYSKQEVYDWISRLIDNGYKYTFLRYE